MFNYCRIAWTKIFKKSTFYCRKVKHHILGKEVSKNIRKIQKRAFVNDRGLRTAKILFFFCILECHTFVYIKISSIYFTLISWRHLKYFWRDSFFFSVKSIKSSIRNSIIVSKLQEDIWLKWDTVDYIIQRELWKILSLVCKNLD